MNNVDDLLIDQLSDLKLLEEKHIGLLPTFKVCTANDLLKSIIESIESMAFEHSEVFSVLIKEKLSTTVKHERHSISSLIADVKLYLENLSDVKNDSGLIANLQRLLSLKTSLLLSANRFARELQHRSIQDQLQYILNETYEANERLDRLAEERLTKKEIKGL